MFQDIPADLPLWAHQRSALKFLLAHLNRTAEPCLIRMPTGTGKTGVIATLSLRCASGRTLVLTPWANLRDQMIDALKEKFWANIGQPLPNAGVAALLPSSAKPVIEDARVQVIVCTFTALAELKRSYNVLYRQLAASIDVVIVDECHYEPAVEWGRAVKGLNQPTVLLTATPYRNDLKLFRIKDVKSSVYHFTHEQAEENSIVRKLDFVPLGGGTEIATLCKAFAKAWQLAKSNGHLASKSARAIVCCATAADIRIAVETLEKEGLKAVGIHEQFDNRNSAWFVQDVPKPDHAAEVWVHQNKLTEGLDDHRFCGVAFMRPMRNDRKLVQQIGRVLRAHTSDRLDVSALMMAPSEYQLHERWLAYREFERDAGIMDAEHFRRVVEGLLEAQPPVEYFEGRFRRRFRTDILSQNAQVAIAPSVLIRRVLPGFTFSDYIEDCTDSLNLTDAVILGQPNAPCQQSSDFSLWVYASVVNSRLLEDTSLYEVRLETHCVVHAGDYLLVSDTTGTFPENLLETSTTGLGASDLARLMDSSYRVTNVAVSSAVPFDTVLRASEHRGHNLGSIPASLTDRIQICRAARGASPTGRRYIGLHRGRVREELSERTRREHSVALFKHWAQSIGAALSASSAENPVLQRYMQPFTAPDAPVPVSVSVDLSHPNIQVTQLDGSLLEIVASSVSIRSNSAGTTRAYECEFEFSDSTRAKASVKVPLSIEYQRNKGRFWFKSRGMTGAHVHETDGGVARRKSLAEYFNQNQEMLLIGIEGGTLVYQGRNFYAVDYAHAERSLFDKIVRPSVAPCMNEKGTKEELIQAKAKGAKTTTFIEGSLFKRIAEGVLPLGFAQELVICDDLGSECADFVVANFQEQAMALVHAKAGDGRGISASAFHEVVAQAMKNLVYLSRTADMPEGVNSWTHKSRWNKTGIPRIYKSPTGCPTGKKLWGMLRDKIINSANSQLHVVLATTGCCDLPTLQAAIHDVSKRTAETAQLLHLLDGLIGYARQLGVRVTILDVPYRASPTKPKNATTSAKKARISSSKTAATP